MADFFAKEIDYKGERCVELSAGNFYALICPAMGANVLRLRDNKRGMEIFRFDENEPMETYKNSPEVYGFPTLYFPNRLSHGKLKTSDGEYELPCNEGFPFFNCLHGFLHKREYNLVRLSTEGDIAAAKFEYIYDDNDEMFQYFPLPFRLEIVYTLGVKGLEQFYTIFNMSDKMLPFGVGSHTSIKAPFVDGGSPDNIRIYAPIGKRIEITRRCIPTGRMLPLGDHDKRYLSGDVNPATEFIDNEFYTAEYGDLDGLQFHGLVIEDTESGKSICYETGEEYPFWIFWNNRGNKGFFCPEPMSWMIDAPNMELPDEVTGYREIEPKNFITAYQRIFTKG